MAHSNIQNVTMSQKGQNVRRLNRDRMRLLLWLAFSGVLAYFGFWFFPYH